MLRDSYRDFDLVKTLRAEYQIIYQKKIRLFFGKSVPFYWYSVIVRLNGGDLFFISSRF